MILSKIRVFHAGLERKEFYEFYELMTALSSPSCGDKLNIGSGLINLKKIIRKLRITVMFPRFNVDYAEAYTIEEAKGDLSKLRSVYQFCGVSEKNAVAKIMGALDTVINSMWEEAIAARSRNDHDQKTRNKDARPRL